MNELPVSIIMRSFNEAWALRDTLPALAAQNHKNWELIVIDSGSTDGSVELLREFKPRHFIQIPSSAYNPARVINHGMKLASSNACIFLNADATPQGPDWLGPLVAALNDSQVAAVFGRQVPRPNCEAVYEHDYERCFGPKRESATWEHFFSMASSGLRKDIWSMRGFNERMQYSEDDEYTRWCRAQGFRVLYVPESIVMHSHNYTAKQAWKRSFGEGRALAGVCDESTVLRMSPPRVLIGWLNDARRDLLFCAGKGRLREWPHALGIRWQQRWGMRAGFREGWKAYRQPNNNASVRPPTWASNLKDKHAR
jgi:rhamnosyltransferase